MTALQSTSGHIVEPSEWPFAAPTLVVPAGPAPDVAPEAPKFDSYAPAPTADSEAELGEILIRVQQFASETEEAAKREAQIIVDSARTEARLIIAGAEQSAPTVVESARIEARRIVEEASGRANQQASEIVESARAESRRIIEQARDEAQRHIPVFTESARPDAQRTIEQAKQQATLHAREIVESARTEAQRIVEEATRANLVQGAAGQSAVSADVIANLTASIKEFADTNAALVEEMTRLRDSVAGYRPDAPVVGPVAAPPTAQARDSQLWGDLRTLGTASA